MSTAALLVLLAAAPPGAVETVDKPHVTLPLQPFTVELLDLERGSWRFVDALGQRLALDGPLIAFAFPGRITGELRLGCILCEPEFPQDLSHATLKLVGPSQSGAEGASFRIDEPCFTATVRVTPQDGAMRCELREISLGPAVTGDRYVAGLYLQAGGQSHPLWLATEVWQGAVALPKGGGLRTASIALPLRRFGSFEVTAQCPGLPPAKLRVCRVPKRRDIDPDRSAIGINLFQQQVWWYAWQAPLMARAGVHWIRPWLAWENTWRTQEPEPGKWDTRALDAALRRMERFGLRYQDILFAAPTWVAGNAACGAPPMDKLDQWSAYVERLVKQYRGRIRYWEVWNEPDLMWPEETRHNAEHYAAMLRATYDAAKRADPDCVLLGLSHAGYEEWLERLGQLGVADTFDIATVHSYAAPRGFVQAIERRRALLDEGGMARKPMWVNELGSTAYDLNPAYNAKYGCSERQQAAHVPALYAQALSMDPRMKAFWFCTYDPRDAAHEDQWTGDCGVGVLYLGFLPKLSYAALAATARELDGRACLGRAAVGRDLHQISFDGDVAVVWHDRPAAPVPATTLGCLPAERITVRDMFGNVVSAGPARGLRLDLAAGTLFVAGSRQLSGIARCEAAVRVAPKQLALPPGGSAVVRVTLPHGMALLAAVPAGLAVRVEVGRGALRLTAAAGVARASGLVRLAARCPAGKLGLAAPYEVVRRLPVTVGEPNLVRDPAFTAGDTAEWTPERTSPYAYDAEVGRDAAGSLRLDGPFDRRLVHWSITPTPGRPLRMRAWVRTAELAGCRATISVALFAADHWIKSYCLASTDPSGTPAIGWPLIERAARIPFGTADWTRLEAELPGDQIPPETNQIAFYVDVQGGTGRLWLDDLDLWQAAGN
ncbi:MAG: hypothetical protein HYU66_00405 [Armatimonadetes bacterium]|nr:hypothetical protein [Armatimonadota bacterium]